MEAVEASSSRLLLSYFEGSLVHMSCSLVLKLEQASGRATTGKVSRTSHCLSPLSVRFTCKQANRAHRKNISRDVSRMSYCRVVLNRRIVLLLTLSHQNEEHPCYQLVHRTPELPPPPSLLSEQITFSKPLFYVATPPRATTTF